MRSYNQLRWRNSLMNTKRMRPSGSFRAQFAWLRPHFFEFCRSWRGSRSVISTQIAIRFLWTTQISCDPVIEVVSYLWCSFRMLWRCLDLAFRYLRKVARTTVLRKSVSRTCRLGACHGTPPALINVHQMARKEIRLLEVALGSDPAMSRCSVEWSAVLGKIKFCIQEPQ